MTENNSGLPNQNPFRTRREQRMAETFVKAMSTGIPKVMPTISSNTPEEIKAARIHHGNGMTVDDLLRRVVTDGASDLHLSCNTKPRYRVDGDLIDVPDTTEITDEWLKLQMQTVVPPTIWETFLEDGEADLSYALKDEQRDWGRFRVNIFKQRGTTASVMRTIPTKIKTIAELGVPDSLNDLVKKKKGLILVTGPTGSGKSTTLTAMLDAINESRREHIVTIEDPIEFVHTNKKSLVNQREVGTDTLSFSEALKRVLRQDPDVILIGELRDAETISTALTAAETGHLVFGTLHTQSAVKTIDRIIDSFPPAQQGQVRSQLSDTLQAVVAQALVKKVGGGRVASTEIMVRTPAIANQIREGKIPQINNDISGGRSKGMHTLDQDLIKLVKEGLVDKDEAIPLMSNPADLEGIVAKANNDWGF